MTDNILKNEDLEKVVGGSDVDSLKYGGKEVALPEAASKKQVYDLANGNYTVCTYYKELVEKKLVCTFKQFCKNEMCPGRK